MAFPSSPTNGQLATVNGIIYRYGSSVQSWTRVVGSIGNLTASNLSVVVNSTIGTDLSVLGNIYIGVGANTTSFTNPIFIGQDSGAGYVQAAIVNTFGNASADFTAYANNGNDTQGWMDMGMTGNVFNDSKYTITGYNDGYIFANGVTGNSSLGGNLVIATGSGGATNDIVFATGGFLAANEKMRFSNATSVFRVAGTVSATAVTSNTTITLNSANVATAIINGGTAGVGNIGASGQGFNTVFAKATSAQYADLAENYLSDSYYEPGTVLMFGGTSEVTICNIDMTTKVAGVVTTKPAHLMNSDITGVAAAIALQGRVPCKVIGPIHKGDMLVSTSNGRARSESDPKVGTLIGKSLEDFFGDEGIIEVAVGRT